MFQCLRLREKPLNGDFKYPPLFKPTQTRIIMLFPDRDDEPIRCRLRTIDLDADWRLQRPSKRPALPKEEIDVLEFGQRRNGRVVCEALPIPCHSISLEYHPFEEYLALSYDWGTPEKFHQIHVNRQPFLISPKVYAALKLRRSQLGTHDARMVRRGVVRATSAHAALGYFGWIDAICVNQAKSSERKAQDRLRDCIFKQARVVMSDLGDEGEGDEPLVMSIMRARET